MKTVESRVKLYYILPCDMLHMLMSLQTLILLVPHTFAHRQPSYRYICPPPAHCVVYIATSTQTRLPQNYFDFRTTFLVSACRADHHKTGKHTIAYVLFGSKRNRMAAEQLGGTMLRGREL
jgi:hypothetical protein